MYRYSTNMAREMETNAVPPRALGSGYLLETEIGSGATGRVFRGRRRFDDAPVAIKVLRPEFAKETDAVVRFLRQRTVLPTVTHPHLVRVHDLVAEGEVIAVIMDLVQGEDLRQVIRRGALTLAQSLQIIGQMAGALAAVHAAGVVHRDIKPENVLVQWDGAAPWAMLTDFGLAKVLDSPVWTSASQLHGTPAYLAPEVVSGRKAGPPADIYALAVMAYELLAGQRPFQADNTAALLLAHLDTDPVRPPGMSSALWQTLQSGLAKDPETRPTATTFASGLTPLSSPGLYGQPIYAGDAAQEQVYDTPTSPGDALSAAGVSGPSPASGGPAGSGGLVAGDDLPTGLPTLDALRPAPPEPVEPKRRKKRWIWWTAGALCLTLGTAAGIWAGRPDPTPPADNTPQPVPHQFFVPITATSSKPGEIRLSFPDMRNQAGFDSYLVYRDKQVVQQLGGDSTTYLYETGDLRTEHCFEVAALLLTLAPPAPLQTSPACLTADGKPRE
jgi:hypothetical protein